MDLPVEERDRGAPDDRRIKRRRAPVMARCVAAVMAFTFVAAVISKAIEV